MTAKNPEDRLLPPWLSGALVRHVVDALGAGSIRFVGGAVRDSVIGCPVRDIDAATSHLPDETMRLLAAAGLRVVPTGLKHGTVTAVSGTQTLEITTLRRDVRTDGRYADVAFTNDWLADAARRDFTMNALYLTPDGQLFDPFDGLRDLRDGHVRFIGEPEARIREDALRIMRFFRFNAWYGCGAPDAVGLAACKALAPLVATLSVERVRDEILKLVSAPDPLPAWRALVSAGLLAHLPLDRADDLALAHVVAQERTLGLPVDRLLRLAALACPDPAAAVALAAAFRLSKADACTLEAAAFGAARPAPQSPAACRRFLYWHGPVAAKAAFLMMADGPPADLWQLVCHWPVPALPVRGADLIACGMAPGPQFSTVLAALEQAWLDSDFVLTRDELLAKLIRA